MTLQIEALRRLIMLMLSCFALQACVTLQAASAPSQNTLFSEHITDDDSFRQWFAYFYAHQRIDLVPEAVRFMASHRYLQDHPDVAAAFLARVFAKYPTELPQWLVSWQPLSTESWAVILVSLQFADTPEASKLMHANITRTEKSEQKRISTLESSGRTASNLLEASIDDPRQINLLWSAFSATGDKRYVEKVVDYLTFYDVKAETVDSAIGQAALITLASNSILHPAVAEVCLSARNTHPDEGIRNLLSSMLTAVAQYVEKETNREQAH